MPCEGVKEGDVYLMSSAYQIELIIFVKKLDYVRSKYIAYSSLVLLPAFDAFFGWI